MNTNRTSGRPSRSTNSLKAALIAGSMIATVMGTGLIARQDVAQTTATPLITDSTSTPIEGSAAVLPALPPGGTFLNDLPAIPRAAAVNIAVVARSRSSR